MINEECYRGYIDVKGSTVVVVKKVTYDARKLYQFISVFKFLEAMLY